LNWINRLRAPTGRLLASAALALASATIALPAHADSAFTATYQGHVIRFTHVSSQSGATAIGVNDPGFAALLRDTGALLTWKPGERYVLITTAVPTVVSFSVGDRRYDVGTIALQASFAPYLAGEEAYLPFQDVLGALDLALRQDAGVAILQPQLAALDVRQEGAAATLFAHAGAPLHARVVQESAGTITYAFDGVGTTLYGTRQVGAGGVRNVQITGSGTVRQPVTLVTVTLEPGAVASAPQNTDGRDVVLSFNGAGNAPPSQVEAQASSAPQTSGAATPSGAAIVSNVSVAPAADGVTVSIAVQGDAEYEWHRLREPDNRFWIDIKNAQLAGAPVEANEASPLQSMRVRQSDPETVRIALSLIGPKAIAIQPSTGGLAITIGRQDVADEPRAGTGSVGSIVAAAQEAPAVTPAPQDDAIAGTGATDDSAWKFGPRGDYVATDPRLIVIDPGHGGSDPGTQHGGLSEADLTLDMAKRLRVILVARGWEVKLTHEANVDVYAPNDSPHDELQARVDVANKAGARIFVSIHVNAYVNPGPNGTTEYISKASDVPLGKAIETHVSDDGTKDDGVIKAHYYVTYHARMPAVLIETAFLTNPQDYALLASPSWRQQIVQEIADGIGDYAREYPLPNQPSQ
jgi:N-acetylmuramoyl-L-alanine amidase